MAKNTRRSFSVAEKCRIIDILGQGLPVKQVAASENISCRSLRRWRATTNELKCLPKTKKTLHKGGTPLFKDAEDQLLQWVLNSRHRGLSKCCKFVRDCSSDKHWCFRWLMLWNVMISGVSAVDMIRYFSATCPGFRCLSDNTRKKWMWRFQSRHQLSYRRRTHLAQRHQEEVYI